MGDTERPAGRSKGWSPLRISLTAIAGLVVVVLLVFAAEAWAGVSRERAAIEAIRRRGEPLHVHDLVFAPGGDESEFEQLVARFGAAFDDSVELDLDSPETFDEQLDELRAWKAGAAAVPVVAEFVECFRGLDRTEDHDSTLGSDWLYLALRDPNRARSLTECQRLGVHAFQQLAEPLIPEAEAVCRSAAATGERSVRAWRAEEVFVPDGACLRAMVAPEVLSQTAPWLALGGRVEEAALRLGLALRGAETIRGLPWMTGHHAWVVACCHALSGLQHTLSLLPPGTDLAEIERRLAAIEPRANLEHALIGERVFGNANFEAVRSSGTGPEVSSAYFRLWLAADRAFYLENMSTAVEQSRHPYFAMPGDAWPWEKDRESFPKHYIVSAMLLPRCGTDFENTATLEARVLVARAALTAFREGAAAGARAAARAVDPFDGAPLRSRTEPDGTLVIWSVARNRVDDGGRLAWDVLDPRTAIDGPPDFVWRVKPP